MKDTGKQKGFHRMVVAGAGAAGISAALSAAEHGLTVDLLEATDRIGGTICRGQLHTLAGLFTPDGEAVDSRICRQLIKRLPQAQKRKIGKLWVLQIEPELYSEILVAWLGTYPKITLHRRAEVHAIHLAGHELTSLGAGDFEVSGTGIAFVDATGSAALAALADQAWPAEEISFGLVARARVTGEPLNPTARVVLKLELESLAAFEGNSVWLDTGFYEDEIFLKFNSGTPPDREALSSGLRQYFGARLTDLFLGEPVARFGPRLRARAPDGILDPSRSFTVSWPYEIWEGAGVNLEWPAVMPFRLSENYLRSAAIVNLFAAGKCAGLPAREMSAARVAGGCWAMGEQVAKMVARESA